MQIVWAKSAERDLEQIIAYFTEKQERDVGLKIISRLLNATDTLSMFPHSGRQSVLPKCRELVIPDLPYFLVYNVSERIEILRVIHTSKLWRG